MTRRRPKPLRWTLTARMDLRQIADYIRQQSPMSAEPFVAQIIAKVDQLREFPFNGSICEVYPKARYLTQGNYVIYYTVHRQEVVVRAVVHGARRFQPSWLRRED